VTPFSDKKRKYTMMKLYGAILLICLTLPLWGQVHRGDWMLGGNASFDISKQIGYAEANFGLQAYPKLGYFFTDRIALTLEPQAWVSYSYRPDLVDGKTRYWKNKTSLGPGISWYPGGKKSIFQPFIYLNPNIPIAVLSTREFVDEYLNTFKVAYNMGLGLQLFVRKEIALDFRFNRYHPTLRSEGYTDVLFGVQVFLPKNKNQKTKK
jgi:hypothetical protein